MSQQTKKRHTASLQEAYDALERSEGDIAEAAEALGIRPHRLHSMVEKHAELQSVVRDREVRIVNIAERTVLEALETIGPVGDRANIAKWALEHLKSDRYHKSNIHETKPQKLSDLSFDELEKLRVQALQELSIHLGKDQPIALQASIVDADLSRKG